MVFLNGPLDAESKMVQQWDSARLGITAPQEEEAGSNSSTNRRHVQLGKVGNLHQGPDTKFLKSLIPGHDSTIEEDTEGSSGHKFMVSEHNSLGILKPKSRIQQWTRGQEAFIGIRCQSFRSFTGELWPMPDWTPATGGWVRRF